MQLQQIQSKIFGLRGYKLMQDSDLAELYETETKRLKEGVRRNISRLPADFMFELDKNEFENLRTQIASSNRGGTRYLTFVFTEQGLAMLANVLNIAKAIEVNIQIVRAFALLRQYALIHSELTIKRKGLEKKYNKKFKMSMKHYIIC